MLLFGRSAVDGSEKIEVTKSPTKSIAPQNRSVTMENRHGERLSTTSPPVMYVMIKRFTTELEFDKVEYFRQYVIIDRLLVENSPSLSNLVDSLVLNFMYLLLYTL